MSYSAKDIRLEPISKKDADIFVKKTHYSGKVDPRSQIHLGAFINGVLLGAMQFGPSIDKRRMLPIVKGLKWNEFIELNRLAFSDVLPKNSESRCISIAIKMLKKKFPQLRLIVSFADGTQCGDGTIYRASGFALTKITKNNSMVMMPDGEVYAKLVFSLHSANGIQAKYGKTPREGLSEFFRRVGAKILPGYQLRYIYFINPKDRALLTEPELPYSAIEAIGATMYKGSKPLRASGVEADTSPFQGEEGGASPTDALHNP